MRKTNYYVLFICIIIGFIFLFIGYKTLEYILFLPNTFDGNIRYHTKIAKNYYLDIGDSTLGKSFGNDFIEMKINEKVFNLKSDSCCIYGETEKNTFKIDLKTDSINYYWRPSKFF